MKKEPIPAKPGVGSFSNDSIVSSKSAKQYSFMNGPFVFLEWFFVCFSSIFGISFYKCIRHIRKLMLVFSAVFLTDLQARSLATSLTGCNPPSFCSEQIWYSTDCNRAVFDRILARQCRVNARTLARWTYSVFHSYGVSYAGSLPAAVA